MDSIWAKFEGCTSNKSNAGSVMAPIADLPKAAALQPSTRWPGFNGVRTTIHVRTIVPNTFTSAFGPSPRDLANTEFVFGADQPPGCRRNDSNGLSTSAICTPAFDQCTILLSPGLGTGKQSSNCGSLWPRNLARLVHPSHHVCLLTAYGEAYLRATAKWVLLPPIPSSLSPSIRMTSQWKRRRHLAPAFFGLPSLSSMHPS